MKEAVVEKFSGVPNEFFSTSMPAVLRTHGRLPISISDLAPILIASPHPDDETLGCGGLIARCASEGLPVSILAMTSGEASHPGDAAWRKKLGRIRELEQQSALKALGICQPDIIRLNLPDGEMSHLNPERKQQLAACILDIIQSRGIKTIFGPAIDDCHDDHQETAKLLAQAIERHSGLSLFSYQIWPPAVRASQIQQSELVYTHDISDLLGLKRRAVQRHRTQLGVIDPAHSEGFRMPPSLLANTLKDCESYALICDVSVWRRLAK